MSLTRPLTRPLTRKISRAELTQGYGGSFSPLLLNPYLLFDARESMVGTLENPTLDLNPALPETLDVITATRSGTATYTDVNGNIATAAADTVRVDHVDGVPMILVEPSATNLLTYSEDFSQWQSLNSTLNAAQTTSPDNTLNGSSLQINSGGYLYVTIASSHGVGDSVTFSCFVKSPLQKLTWGGATANGTDVYSYEDVGNGWYRQILTRTFSSAGSIQPMFNEIQAGSDVFYIWGAQLEAGSVATSYIPTSGSTVTRQADNLVISGSDFTDFYNQSEGTTYVETVPRTTDDYRHLYEYSQDGDNRMNNFLHLNNNRAYFETGNVVQANLTFGATSLNQLNRIATSYKTNDLVGSSNGSSEVTDTTATIPTAMNKLCIGAYLFGSHLNGHIKRLIYWPYHSDSL